MPPPDNYKKSTLEGPARQAFVITPADATDLANFTTGIYVGGTGNITVQMVGGTGNVLFSAIPAGTVLPIQVRGVDSTNTTATLLIGLF